MAFLMSIKKFLITFEVEILTKIRRNHEYLITYEELCMKFSNSERKDECIDFTMMCFFSVYRITNRNNAPISNFGGGFRWKSEYPWCII
ncbi:Uncharacterized protein FWK35_00008694 [Aphis craccivora]|uniref:Uncharacterized protein n=1 Tax=Aphis craccivora TaxID=307492 RepID=A0A6G0YZ12_APHCR|nr:Uncharacterized protein FWK35_00008694 [Aphis craccivora]